MVLTCPFSNINSSSTPSRSRWTAKESYLRMTLYQSQLQYPRTCSAKVLSLSNPTERHARERQLSQEDLAVVISEPLSPKKTIAHQLTSWKQCKRVLQSLNREFRQKVALIRVEKAYIIFLLLKTQISIAHPHPARSLQTTLTELQLSPLVRVSNSQNRNRKIQSS